MPKIISMVILFALTASAATIMHKFIAIDNGNSNLLYVNEYDSTQNWIVPINASDPRDMQLIGNNRILIGHDGGYLEFDLTTGKVLKDVNSFNSPVLSENLGTASARRLINGHTLLTGINIGGSTGLILLEVDSLDTIVNKTVYPGNYVRLMRETASGTYLFACDTVIQEGDNTGAIVSKTHVAGMSHAWKAVRLPNDDMLISAGYGTFMVEVDKSGNIVGKFGEKDSVPPAVNPYFYATFQLLTNGDVVVANWQGHGTGNGASGIQLLEFNPAGAIVWEWSKAAIISSLQGILILDSLNTDLLYDERTGTMQPLTTTSVSNNTVKYGSNNTCPFKFVPHIDGICLSPPTENPYSVSILNVAGMSIARFSGRGAGFVPMTSRTVVSGVYLVRISSDGREFVQPLRMFR